VIEPKYSIKYVVHQTISLRQQGELFSLISFAKYRRTLSFLTKKKHTLFWKK